MKKYFWYWFKQIGVFLLLLLFVGLLFDWYRRPDMPIDAAHAPFNTLQHTEPNTLAQLSEHQTLVLYFWGNWCAICRHTSPTINRLHKEGVPVLGVALRSGTTNDLRHYLQQHQLQFNNLNDENGHFSKQWHIQVTPTIVLIKNGKIFHSLTGLTSYPTLKLWLFLSNLNV